MIATSIPWARIMAPVAGGSGDKAVIEAACTLAAPFGAEVAAVFAPADVADLMPWMGDGFMGGVQVAAVESLKEAADEGRKAAEAAFAACAYANKTFISLESPVWSSLSMHSRLSDVVVFGSEAARARGPLAQAFQQMIAAEQRPVVVARPGLDPQGVMAVAWDGGKEASRAMRTALPLLQRARAVHIVACAGSSPRVFDPEALRAFLKVRAVESQITLIEGGGEVGAQLLKAAHGLGADLFVAGAYGHPRLQEFIFGGATRAFLNAESPSLFLSH
ncbi:MAG TPA: universal stress protein [Caulobacteraceae bacterium]|jgi:nucleotide-binding universal stress UspA family protein